MTDAYELHTHLYGCLVLDDLYWLHARNKPRWEIFASSYEKAYGKIPDYHGIMNRDAASQEKLKSLYYYTISGDFAKFQASFDLVIALAWADPEEIYEISRRVISRQEEAYTEYRILFPPRGGITVFQERIHAFAEGLAAGANENSRNARGLISISRETEFMYPQYEAIKGLMKNHQVVGDRIVGIDFCGDEEPYPPEKLDSFIKSVNRDNSDSPDLFLAVAYHVGESFKSISLESSVRRVYLSARMGVNRLGHAISLGINPELYTGKTRLESPAERYRQISFYIENFESLQEKISGMDLNILKRELDSLYTERENEDPAIRVFYDKSRIDFVRRLQDWAMDKIREIGTPIESCITSNIRITEADTIENHPLPRFLSAGMTVILGADDPGILKTDLKTEYDLARSMGGVSDTAIENMIEASRNNTSRSSVTGV